jgi:DNA polymerase I-like protein with 3'-5' exonuclease and polymerase domains
MSSMAKGLIECPDKDWLILDIDLSQIDYRVVASATNNPNVVSSYVNDPSTDYHGMVGKLAGISRRHGKTLNLAIGFGMGERSAVALVKKTLKADSEEFLTSGMEFTDYCEQRSKKMYKDYHLNLPELKATSNRATSIAKQNGYIANIHGRRRHFPEPRYMTIKGKNKLVSFYHRAFASYVQSSAADIAKFLTVQIDELIRDNELVKLVAVVHDSWVFYVHKSVYMGLALEISRIIRSVDTLRVPILNSCEISSTNWAACKPIPNFNFNFGYW